ncbi:UNKNOWN [Stylonychia lemnae]|uniref:RIIa domain-containing protein n=1 Tax=Stylonychia lemnae TaxID=5949 RepID=A0A078B8G3_STYLE|nr:UNKNOWN [Stylonychia lemnae]|eukprot:CDW89582.1 UNKNOWN [Stylonychia lemnae]
MQSQIQHYLSQIGIDKLLIDAFKEVAFQKPSDPLVFIGEYLQERANIPQSQKIMKTDAIIPQEFQQNSISISKDKIKKDNIFIELDKNTDMSTDFKSSYRNALYIQESERPFIEQEDISITLEQRGGRSYQQTKNELEQKIVVGQDSAEDDDDDYFDEINQTPRPHAGVLMDFVRYETNTHLNDSITTELSADQNPNKYTTNE